MRRFLHYAPGGVDVTDRRGADNDEGPRPHALSAIGRRRLFLTYVSPVHYNTMVPQESGVGEGGGEKEPSFAPSPVLSDEGVLSELGAAEEAAR